MTLPTDLSGLIVWYRGDSVTANGTVVASLLDKSGTGDPNKVANQLSAGLRPTLNAVDPNFNSNPTIQFNGSQYLVTGTFTTPITQPTTRFIVGLATGSGPDYIIDSINPSLQYSVSAPPGSIVQFNGGTLSIGANFAVPGIVIIVDNGASSSCVLGTTVLNSGNAGPNGATGLTIGAYAGTGFNLTGTIAEIIIYNRVLSATEIQAVAGYLQQRYGIPVFAATVSPTLVGPSLADLRLAAQQRADRVNVSTISTSEWNWYINKSAQELYGLLASTYQDYNVKSVAVTLPGGSQAGNSFQVGPNQTIASDFFQPRALWLQIGGSPTPYVTIPRLESLNERNLYVFPNIVPVYGAIPSRWNILGSTIEILPPTVGGNQYVLWYVPALPTLSSDTDSIAQYWLSINGWDEYVTLDAAAKALIKEESLDTANLLLQQKMALRERILREAAPRDISQPQSIVDMNRIRNPWGGWGAGGMPGPGWGGDGTGTGCW
ncbi:MAG TPA: hypothetical protein VE987_14680 [Polyangiaceae bacterium]|nr:hypothetical protein [Polyangiaceae bacterium]